MYPCKVHYLSKNSTNPIKQSWHIYRYFEFLYHDFTRKIFTTAWDMTNGSIEKPKTTTMTKPCKLHQVLCLTLNNIAD